jgi:hypothetical protein
MPTCTPPSSRTPICVGPTSAPVDLDRLAALSGAIISRAQAERILVELANVVVTD